MGFFKFYKEEVEVIKDRDPAIKKDIEAILYPSFWAIYNYRKAHKLYLKGKVFKARRISQRTARKTGKKFILQHRLVKDYLLIMVMVWL